MRWPTKQVLIDASKSKKWILNLQNHVNEKEGDSYMPRIAMALSNKFLQSFILKLFS